MLVFEGNAEATERKARLRDRVSKLGTTLKVASIVFSEDLPSVKYASLKKRDAQEIGIEYEISTVSISEPMHAIHSLVSLAVADEDIHGVIVQKPAGSLIPSAEWWKEVVSSLTPEKDLDGLTENRLVLPATARAVCEILEIAAKKLNINLASQSSLVLGRSEIVGKPVAEAFTTRFKMRVALWGRAELKNHREHHLAVPLPAKVIVSATGVPDVLSIADLAKDSIIIDCGSPTPEVNPVELATTAAFLSPVPGGVGPMTRICLLENLLDLVQYHS